MRQLLPEVAPARTPAVGETLKAGAATRELHSAGSVLPQEQSQLQLTVQFEEGRLFRVDVALQQAVAGCHSRGLTAAVARDGAAAGEREGSARRLACGEGCFLPGRRVSAAAERVGGQVVGRCTQRAHFLCQPRTNQAAAAGAPAKTDPPAGLVWWTEHKGVTGGVGQAGTGALRHVGCLADRGVADARGQRIEGVLRRGRRWGGAGG